MTTITKVVPGKVLNHGIVSGETFTTTEIIQTSPAHFPDFAAVTPKGTLDKTNITLSAFRSQFGDMTDYHDKYYNPVIFAIEKLIASQNQHSIGFKRLTNNYVHARTVWGVVVIEGQKIPDYKRDEDGNFVIDSKGDRVLASETTLDGAHVALGWLTLSGNYFNDDKDFAVKKKGAKFAPLEMTVGSADGYPDDTPATFWPLASFISGVGDSYNKMFLSLGHTSSTDWDAVNTFVQNTGSFPFQMSMGYVTDAGRYVEYPTQSGGTVSMFTLFPTRDKDASVDYSISRGLGEFTGANINRPIERVDAPFNDLEVYELNIDRVCRLLYGIEYPETEGTSTSYDNSDATPPTYRGMNPIDFKDAKGRAYYRIAPMDMSTTIAGLPQGLSINIAEASLTTRMRASGGIDPFLQGDGKFPDAPTDWNTSAHGDWVTDPDGDADASTYQYWYMTQDLIEAHYQDYLFSKNFRDVIRDRTSHLWDLGYRKEITRLFFQATMKRKDFMAVGCATQYGDDNSVDQCYIRSKSLYTYAVQFPESEEYNAPTTRISINLWDAYYIDEPTFEKFSLNIDLMVAMAAAGGSLDGRVSKANLPDMGNNAKLRIAHSPAIGFEDDDPAADDLIRGCITLRPVNMTEWKRPALPTVYPTIDSVLKDKINVWYGVIIEKILQDQWIMVCGQRMSALSYLATVHDNADAEIHNRLGSCLSSWDVQVEFREKEPNARSRMFTKVVYWVGKARYMMDAVLEARNDDELDEDTTTS